MGQLANSVGTYNWERQPAPGMSGPGEARISELVRVIPGSRRGSAANALNQQASQIHEHTTRQTNAAWQFFSSILPDSFRLLVPGMLGWALADLTLIAGIFVLEFASIGRSVNSRIVLFYLFVFLMFALQCRLYSDEPKAHSEQIALCKSLFWTCLLTLMPLGRAAVKDNVFPLILFTAVNASALSLARELWRVVAGPGTFSPSRRALIVGDPDFASSVMRAIEQSGYGEKNIRGFLPQRHLRRPDGNTILQKIARQECIDELIVATRDSGIVRTVSLVARLNQLDFLLLPNLEGLDQDETDSLEIRLLKVREQIHPEWELAAKRIVDFVISTLLLCTLSPLLLLIAIAIWHDSPGPILYRAPRIGRKGHRFNCLKFRTMFPCADALKSQLRAHNEREGAFFKLANDPRVTRIGRVLRRFSLDELPQLWNVLVGDMSLVGPRPHPPDDVERYNLEDLRRLDFTPGMTGLWQVSARRDPSFRRCVTLDVQYIAEWSLLLDFKILWRTIGVVLHGSGV